jgi:hypothetical protein
VTHTNSTPDPIDIAFAIAARRGLDLCLDCLAVSTDEAGVLDAPPRDSGDLDSDDVAMIDTLLREHRLGRSLTNSGDWTAMQAATRLRVVARIASLVLPPCVYDYEDRFAVRLDEDGHLPDVTGAQNDVLGYLMRVEDYLAEHDSGQWIDPNALAGEVANVHDAVRMVETLLDLTGTHDTADA